MTVRALAVIGMVAGLAGTAAAAGEPRALPAGEWPVSRSQPILDKTKTVRLAPGPTNADPDEAAAIRDLIAAGRIVQSLYEDMKHHQALQARSDLARWSRESPGRQTRNSIELYRLFEGPIANTLDNRREPFLPVDSLAPGKSFYPWGVRKAEIDGFLATHPDRRESILGPRTVVRRADARSLEEDLASIERHPALDVLHPGLADRLRALARKPAEREFYAVPYPVAHADSIFAVVGRLNAAAARLERGDRDFAGYLRHRARDLLANDYEAGDASWVKGRFHRLNAQIGAYETYDDELFGVKAAYGLSVMRVDEPRTRAVRDAIRGLQDFENALPYAAHKKVIEDIPVGVYDVIADFGQARSANTATILPNESETARRYGRIIMIRRNILMHPAIIAAQRRAFDAAIARAQQADFDPEGRFYVTLWHEIGHYLGPDRDRRGRELDAALQEVAGTFEEMKADLVALFVGTELKQRGYYDDRKLEALYAAGVLRMLNKNKPRPDQAYGVMTLMQLNWFLDRGALLYDPTTRKLSIRYDRYHDAVASLIDQVLAIQFEGDRAAADRFITRWTTWDDRHESLARAMRETETNRYWMMRYAVLGE